MSRQLLKHFLVFFCVVLFSGGILFASGTTSWGDDNSGGGLIDSLKESGNIPGEGGLDLYPEPTAPIGFDFQDPIDGLLDQFNLYLIDPSQLPQGFKADDLIVQIFGDRIVPVLDWLQRKRDAAEKETEEQIAAVESSNLRAAPPELTSLKKDKIGSISAAGITFLSGCQPKATPKGDVIVCSSADLFGIDAGRGSDEITVNAGVTVSSLAMDPPVSSQPQTTTIDGAEDNDTIINNGTVSATALSAGNLLKLSPSNGNDKDTAESNDQEEKKGALAIAIQGNEGEDVITNSGSVIATAVTTAADIETGSTSTKVDIGASEAVAEAVGIDGGSDEDVLLNSGAVTATATATSLKSEITSNKGLSTSDDAATAIATTTGMQGGDGNDSVTNDGSITAVSTATVAVGNGSGGTANPLTTLFSAASPHKAEAVSTGLVTGDGDDTISNTNDITAVSTATSNAIVVDIPANGTAKAVASSQAKGDSTAVATGEGNDTLKNEGDMVAVATAEATAQSSIVAKSGKASLSPSTFRGGTTAESKAMGVDTGAGTDNVNNSGTIVAVATSATYSGAYTIATEGQATADTKSTAKAVTTGIDMGNGSDSLNNTGDITAVSTATAATVEFAFSDKKDAATNKKGISKSGVEAEAVALGISGDGTEGTTESDKYLKDLPHEITMGASYSKLAAGGDNTITNQDSIAAVATAVSGAGTYGISIEGASSADAESKATSNAKAIDAGMGNDTIKNYGEITAVSTAAANSAGFGFSEGKKGDASVGATSEAEATGISADGMPSSFTAKTELVLSLVDGIDEKSSLAKIAATGDDMIINDGAVTSVATAESGSAGVSVSIKEANSASATANASASALGVDLGGGNDTLENTGQVTAVATAAAGAVEFSFSKAKDAGTATGWFSEAKSSNGVMAEAQSTGIRGDGTMASYLFDTSLHIGLDGIAEKIHFDKSGSTGNDKITNDGSVTSVATAVAGEVSTSVSVDGAAKADGLSKATAKAMGIDAGSGDDTVSNTGSLNSVATATAGVFEGAFSKKDADSSRGWFDMMFIEQGARSDAEAIGIKGDSDDFSHVFDQIFSIDLSGMHTGLRYEYAASSGTDTITNDGDLTAVATATSGAGSMAVSIEGDAKADSESKATARAKAIDGGMGDDDIDNTGETVAVATATAASVGFSYSGNEDIKKGPSGSVSVNAESMAEAIGISADGLPASKVFESNFDLSLNGLDTSTRLADIAASGNDTIDNTGNVTAVATATSVSGDLAVTTDGSNTASAKAIAKANAIGIDGGTGDDTVTNSGNVTVVSTATAGAVEIAFSKEKGAGTETSFLKKAFTENGSVAEAEAIGIRADGTENSSSTELALHMDFNDITQTFHHETVGSTGMDTVTNSGNVASVATATSGQLSTAVAADYVWIEGSAKAEATSKATSKALGIEAGDGDDTVTNSGQVTAVSTSTALALAATFSKGGSSDTSPNWLAKKIVDYGAHADAEAVGVKGDGDYASHYVDEYFSISAKGIQTGAGYEYAASNGNDTIDNSGEGGITAVATAVSGSASVSASAEGTASADSTSKAKSTATAVNAGAGDDTVTNNADLTAVSTATAGALGISVTKTKGNNADAGASAESEAIGISGDGTLGSGLVAASLDVDLEGLRAVTGLEISSASGDDTITNNDSITAVSTAASGAGSIAVSLEGAAATNMSSTAKSTAIAIDAGSGDDTVTNNGILTAVSTATAAAFSAGVSGKGGDFKEDFKAVFSGGTKAESTAKGLTGDSTGKDFASWSQLDISFTDLDVHLLSDTGLVQAGGQDTLTNTNLITATAVAVAPSVDVAVALDGKATAVSTAEAAAKAIAIDAGTDDDTVYNTGELVATAVSTAEAVNIALSKSSALAADTIWNGSTEATAEAVGISGDGEGRDWNASSEIEVTDEAVRLNGELSTTVVSGVDTITNDGPVVATAVSAVPSLGVAVSVDSTGAAVSTAESEARAYGIDGGAEGDTISNSGGVAATSVATAAVLNVAVTKSMGLTGNSLWNGGTEARSEAVGISGDGQGRDWTATGEIAVTNDYVYLGTDLASTVVSGDDTIESTGPVVATSVATAPTAAVTVSYNSVGAAVGTASAESRAVGIDAGSGSDTVTSTEEVVATSVATAGSMNIALTKSGSWAGSSLWDGATTAESEAIGISGDGEGRDWTAAGDILVADGNVWLSTELNSFIAGGDDTINNYGTIAATSVATVPSLGVSVSVNGVSGAVAKGEAESRAAAIDAGTGNDRVLNSSDAELVATSIATAADLNVSVSKSFALAGGGLWDGATTADSEAVGISGDGRGQDYSARNDLYVIDGDVYLDAYMSSTKVSGRDDITNHGSIVSTSVAAAPSAAVSVGFSGGSAALATAESKSRAVGIDAGAGSDTVLSTGAIVATADATTATGNIAGGQGFAAATGGLWDGGAQATAEGVGISGDGEGRDHTAAGSIMVSDGDVLLASELSSTTVTGDDTIDNEGTIVATSVAAAPTIDVAVAVEGFAMAASKATGKSRAAGIDGGSGNDEVTSNGTIVATSVANADAVSVAVTPSGVTSAGGAFWDGGVQADSESVGMSGDGKGQDYHAYGSIAVIERETDPDKSDVHLNTELSSTMASGNDTLTNDGTIVASSLAAAPSLGVSVAVSGVAASSASAAAKSKSMGMDGGSGNDTISSSDEIVSTSVASANAISVSVTTGGLTVAMDSFDGGTTAESEAIGISGDGEGRDWFASGAVDVTGEGVSIVGETSSNVVKGDDTINNDGAVTATSVSEALSGAVSVAVEGVALGASTSTSKSNAVGIDGGAGDDLITNNGAVVSTSVANANAVAVSFTTAGVSGAAGATLDGGSKASAEAIGISGDGKGTDFLMAGSTEVKDGAVRINSELSSTMVTGDDTIDNTATVVATSAAVTPSVGVALTGAGLTVAAATSTAESRSAAIDAGAGSDDITNSGELVSTSVASANSVAVAVSLVGVAGATDGFWNGGTTAKSEAIGICGDGNGQQDLNMMSGLEVTDKLVSMGTHLSSMTNSGDDVIDNSGKITATSVAEALSVNVGFTTIGVAAAKSTATAESRAAAIDAGAGNDAITNYGELVSTSAAVAIPISASVLVGPEGGGGVGFSSSGATAVSEAVGISGDGQGSNLLIDEQLDIIKNSEEDIAVTNDFIVESTMVRGDDAIDNSGDITVTSVAEVPSKAVSFSLIGATAALSSSEAEARAVAIDAGSGDDFIVNNGELVATAVANANTVNISVAPLGGAIAGDTVWDGGTKATAEAVGISGDGKGTDQLFDSSIEVAEGDAIIATAFDTSAASGDDFIDNDNDITATSVAVAPSIGVAVAVGVAGAASTATAESRAAAIDAGGGNDIIDNSGELVATSVANADAVSVSVSGGGSVSGDAFWNGGTTAKSQAVGISGDGNGLNDSVGGIIAVEDDIVRMGAYLSSEAASGNDMITNTGKITATSVSVAPSVNIAASAGYAASIASATAESEAMAIDAGAGDDTIFNSGELVATSVANADAIAATVLVSPFGAAVSANGIFDGGVTATSHAAGITGDGIGHDENTTATLTVESKDDVRLNAMIATEAASGNDTITNDGKITATSVAVAPAATVSMTLNGVAASVSTATAEATAVAIDAGSGDDTVTNTGELIATSVANADAVNITTGLFTVAVAADAVWNGGTTATAKSVGISGDNMSPADTTLSTIEAVDGEVSFDTIISNEYAGGNDTITNEGNINTTAVVVAPSVSVAAAGGGIAAAMSTATADSTAVSIGGGAGNDVIINHGVLETTSVANADAVSVSVTGIGASVAADAVWDGGTKATANAVGISGDGIGSNEKSEAVIEYKDNKILLGLTSETEAVNGIDTIANTNEITATSVAVTPSIGVAASGIGISAAMNSSTAEAYSAAIDAGDSGDTVDNSGRLKAESLANADAVSVAASLIGVSGAGTAVWDGGTNAKAEAVGINGDSFDKESTLRTIEITDDGVTLMEEKVRETTGGNDTIANTNEIEAKAKAVTFSADVALTGIGVAAAVSTSTAEAKASAIDAGGGSDTVSNTADLTVDSDAVGVAVAVGIAPVGIGGATDAVWDGGTTATAEAVGIGGDGSGERVTTTKLIEVDSSGVDIDTETVYENLGGDDTLTNEGVIVASADAKSTSVGVSAVVIGVSSASSIGTARAETAAIDAGGGNDTVVNREAVGAFATAEANTVETSVGLGGVTADIYDVLDVDIDEGDLEEIAELAETEWDSSTSAEATAAGILGGVGNDSITNQAYVRADSSAKTTSTGVSASLFGAAGAIVAASADAEAVAIDSGAGDDTIKNSAQLVSVADADAIGTSVAVELIGFAGTETKTTATAETFGIATGEGNSAVCNGGDIISDAHAKSTAVDVTVTVAGAGMSATPYSGQTLAQSNAAGIFSTDGTDTLTNDGFTSLLSKAEIGATSVTVGIAGYSEADISSTAIAYGTGMEGGNDDDKLANRGTIQARLDSLAQANSIGVELVGASHADAGSDAEAYGTGMAGGSGNDEIVNAGLVDLQLTADASSTSVNVNLVGASAADAATSAYSSAVGLDGGSGNDELHNIGTTEVKSTAKAPVTSTTIDLSGVGNQKIGSEAYAFATGADLGSGNDFLGNTGTLKAEAEANNKVDGVNFTLAGASSGQGTANAGAVAVGVEAASGEDIIFNEDTIDVDAVTTIDSFGDTIVVFGASGADASINGSSKATGISGGNNEDQIFNAGNVNVLADIEADSNGSAWNLAGAAGTMVGMDAYVEAIGLDGGSGHDLISNTGQLTVLADATSTLNNSSWTLAGSSGDRGSLTSTGKATGIFGADGNDKIYNINTIDVDVATSLTATGGSDAIFGKAGSGADLFTEAYGEGVVAGNGNDLIANLGSIDLDSVATMTSSSVSFSFIGSAATEATLEAKSQAVGIDSGAGNDEILNEDSLTVDAMASLTATGGAKTSFTVATKPESIITINVDVKAEGINSGTGNDDIHNYGSIEVASKANPSSSNDVTVGGLFVGGVANSSANAKTTATAADLDSGSNTFYNAGSVKATAKGTASATSKASGELVSAFNHARANADVTIETIKAVGIAGLNETNEIANEEGHIIEVEASPLATTTAEANGESAVSGFATAIVSAEANNAKALGITLGDSNNKVRNSGTMTVTVNPQAKAHSISDASGIGAGQEPDSTAKATAKANDALAVGIDTGDGNNIIQNEGFLTVTASPTVDKAHAEGRSDGFEVGIDSFAYTWAYANNAEAYGIRTGGGSNSIWNTGTITVKSLPKAIADSDAYGKGWDGDATAKSYAYAENALAIGIQTGSGDDEIWNDGTIYVEFSPYLTATSEASGGCQGAWDFCNDGEEDDDTHVTSTNGWKTIGIDSGGGDDLVVNNGTITTALLGGFFTGMGVGVDTGSGNDILALTDGSRVDGFIDLGSGDDVLNLSGTPVTTAFLYSNGYIDGGADTDTAILYGGGSYAGALVNFEGGLKLDPGTYTIPAPPPFDILEVVEGTLVLEGDYTFNNDGTYVPHIDPDGSCGVLEITGTTVIDGEIQLVDDEGAFVDGTDYDILLAEGLSGNFDKLDLPDTPILTFSPQQDNGSVGVEVNVESFKTMADTASEDAIADYLDRLTPLASGDLNKAIGEFQRLSASEFNQAFASVNPEQYASSAKSYMESSQQSFAALQDRLNTLRDSLTFTPFGFNNSYAQYGFRGNSDFPVKQLGFWHNGSKLYTYEELPGVTKVTLDTGRFASIGFDQAISSNFIVGFGKDYTNLTNSFTHSGGQGDISSVKHFLYGSYFHDSYYLDTAFFYGNEEYAHQREFDVGARNELFSSDHRSNSYSSYVEAGRLFKSGSLIFQTYTTLEYMLIEEEAFSEAGENPMALRINNASREQIISNIGVRTSSILKLDNLKILPEISIAWLYYLNPGDMSTTASFVTAPDEYFTINGDREKYHALGLGAAFKFLHQDNFSMELSFNGEFFGEENRQDVKWELGYKF